MKKSIIQWANRWLNHKKNDNECDVIMRPDHIISRDKISQNALRVMYRLKEAGYQAFLVGGGVRDLLLNRTPKDFDVATDAHPEAVRTLFRNSRIIGRRFRLVHVFYDGEIIEVSTFRANVLESARSLEQKTQIHAETGMIHRDNTYGTVEEDAWRRDFTVNALYYNIADFSVVDYTHGMHDLKQKLIRIIGDPTQRFHEDPVRLLRAIRFCAKLNFELETETETAVKTLSHLLQHVPTSRLYDENLKLFFEGNAWATYQKLVQYRYMHALFPQTMHALQSEKKSHAKLIELAMKATDARLKTGDSVNPAFLLAILLWPELQEQVSTIQNKKVKFYLRLHQFIIDIIHAQVEAMMIPKRLQFVIQAIWVLQFQLEKRRPNRILNTFHHRYFRAAFDFMGLRVQAGEINAEHYEWWKQFQTLDAQAQEALIESYRSPR
ncbi:MAG TPA: polynucleotide adenylyltransferase PcnB [Coxiellaceae bacterium]|nr:polynucleotide adenylyltransferase PcnB [Coxiellaceae bacterium]